METLRHEEFSQISFITKIFIVLRHGESHSFFPLLICITNLFDARSIIISIALWIKLAWLRFIFRKKKRKQDEKNYSFVKYFWKVCKYTYTLMMSILTPSGYKNVVDYTANSNKSPQDIYYLHLLFILLWLSNIYSVS